MPCVAIVSDTHVPTREPSIPDWVADEIERANHAIHAGDFGSNETYERIVDLAGAAADLTMLVTTVEDSSLAVGKQIR